MPAEALKAALDALRSLPAPDLSPESGEAIDSLLRQAGDIAQQSGAAHLALSIAVARLEARRSFGHLPDNDII
jgi:hypothetical protein